MKDSSTLKNGDKTPSFNRLLILATILQATELKRVDFIRRKYEDQALDYDVSISFFELFGFIIIKQGNIQLVGDFKSLMSKGPPEVYQFKKMVAECLLADETRSEFINDFLSLFKRTDQELVLHLTLEERLKFSEIRNLFVELGMIEFVVTYDAYRVQPRLMAQVEQAINKTGKRAIGVEQFAQLLANQEKLGKAAELRVLEYEQKRLKSHPSLVSSIEHTALINVGAGYDICSWEDPSVKPSVGLRRHIEVKAVSAKDFGFMWTRNEIDCASRLKDRYYLYLVPVLSAGKFDVGAMEVISDPYQNVFSDEKGWSKSEKVYTIWKQES